MMVSQEEDGPLRSDQSLSEPLILPRDTSRTLGLFPVNLLTPGPQDMFFCLTQQTHKMMAMLDPCNSLSNFILPRHYNPYCVIWFINSLTALHC